MSFDVSAFASSPSVEKLNSLKKSELIQVAKHYGIEVNVKARKDAIKILIIEYFVDENVFTESDLENLNVSKASPTDTDNSVELKKLRVRVTKGRKRI